MSIKHAVLALLQEKPAHGYRLRSEFEERTGRSWPVNIGQIYTTLARLERDGLVEVVVGGTAAQNEQNETSDRATRAVQRGSADDDASVAAVRAVRREVEYRITEAGRDEATTWFATPVLRSQPLRDELAIKLAMAATLPNVDVGALIARQRNETLASFTHYTRLQRTNRRASPPTPADVAWDFTIDRLLFDMQAELQWLERCEARLAQFLAGA